MTPWLLVGLTLTECVLLLAVLLVFKRLRRSEALLEQLQQRQQQFVAKLAFSAELEQELVATFEQRQQELARLDEQLAQRSRELEELLARAERAAPSGGNARQPVRNAGQPVRDSGQPDTRRIVVEGHKRGLSPRTLAQAAGVSVEEVELILLEAKRG